MARFVEKIFNLNRGGKRLQIWYTNSGQNKPGELSIFGGEVTVVITLANHTFHFINGFHILLGQWLQ